MWDAWWPSPEEDGPARGRRAGPSATWCTPHRPLQHRALPTGRGGFLAGRATDLHPAPLGAARSLGEGHGDRLKADQRLSGDDRQKPTFPAPPNIPPPGSRLRVLQWGTIAARKRPYFTPSLRGMSTGGSRAAGETGPGQKVLRIPSPRSPPSQPRHRRVAPPHARDPRARRTPGPASTRSTRGPAGPYRRPAPTNGLRPQVGPASAASGTTRRSLTRPSRGRISIPFQGSQAQRPRDPLPDTSEKSHPADADLIKRCALRQSQAWASTLAGRFTTSTATMDDPGNTG